MTTMRLVVSDGAQAGLSVEVGVPLTIGRRGQLVLDDPSVSDLHARVAPAGDSLQISDLDSPTGTWVNGIRIAPSMRVRPGDQIRVGAIGLEIVAGATAAPPLMGLASPDGAPIPYATDLVMAQHRSAARLPAAALLTYTIVVVTALMLVLYFATR